jgi:hypothetical protein
METYLASSMNATLLSILDRQLEVDDFESRLVHEVLFSPRLIAPDVFFFISDQMWTHVTHADSPRTSLFCRALAEKIIVPAFREEDRSLWDFESVFNRHLKGRPAIRWWASEFAKELGFWSYGRHDDATYFSTDSAAKLKAYLGQIAALTSDQFLEILGPVSDEGFHRRGWMETSDYLSGLLHDASKISKPNELTRGALQRILGERKGLPMEIWEDSKKLEAAHDGYEKRRVSACLGLINASYHPAVASPLGSRPTFCAWTVEERIVSTVLRPEIKRGEELATTVRIPPYPQMARHPEKIIDARNTCGQKYIQLAESWCKGANNVSKSEVISQLNVYAEDLRKRFETNEAEQNPLLVFAERMPEAVSLEIAGLGLAYIYFTLTGTAPDVSELLQKVPEVLAVLAVHGGAICYGIAKQNVEAKIVLDRPAIAHPLRPT